VGALHVGGENNRFAPTLTSGCEDHQLAASTICTPSPLATERKEPPFVKSNARHIRRPRTRSLRAFAGRPLKMNVLGKGCKGEEARED
jgi:hypothetical protein